MARRVVESIVAEGFVSYGPEQCLRLGARGPVALVGDSGVGKSAIASKALVWALYGKGAPERMGASTQAVRGRSIVADGCSRARVTVRIRSSTGESWTIERTRTRSAGDRVVVQSSVHGALTEGDIQHIVGCSYDVFCRTVVRGQGDVWAFSEATDARKREILDEVSGGAALGPLADRARELSRAATAAAKSHFGPHALALEQRVSQIEVRGQRLAGQRADWDAQYTAEIAERRATVAALEAAERTAAASDAAAEAAAAQSQALQAARPTLDWGPYHAAEQSAADALSNAVAARAVAEQRWQAVAHLAPGTHCPTCAQEIAPNAPVARQRAAAKLPWEQSQGAEARARMEVKAAAEATAGARRWLAEREAEHADQIAQLGPVHGGALALARAATRGARESLAAAERATNPYTEACQATAEELHRAQRDRVVLLEAAELARDRERLADAAYQVLSPKGFRAGLVEGTLAGIEHAGNHWLDALSQGRMQVRFRRNEAVERIDTIVAVIDRTSGEWTERALLDFSGGERARINLAVDLGVASAFDASGTTISLLVLDEQVFSGLDSAGQAAIVQLLHAAGVADVVVVDHSPALAGALGRSVRATIGPDGHTRLTEVTGA